MALCFKHTEKKVKTSLFTGEYGVTKVLNSHELSSDTPTKEVGIVFPLSVACRTHPLLHVLVD